ncbi:hypothetical protein BVC80_9101g16 [Macleaya cordata]|uniref:Uncharacterized protein n=1 Tax=Macleaya cordata TaxID=56857 RepID=A0A200QG70_MACCD|nr:hypothetical protein BVC80_9101g16 [Macleaya cordata]
MGSSVSVHKNPDSVMKFQLPNGSKAKQLFSSSSTRKQLVNEERPVVDMNFKSQSSLPPRLSSFQNLGSKEETFFDSQAWLESDCDDDFLSVNGDFTPSRNSASNPQSNSTGTRQLHQSLFMCGTPESTAESSPTDKKKRLSDLLQESFVGDDVSESDKQNTGNAKVEVRQANLDLPPKTTKRAPYVSGLYFLCSTERSPSRHSKPEKEKSAKSAQCCLPSLVTSRSFNERKKRLSPDRSG